MMHQASWPCSLRFFAALAIVSAPAMIFADAGDDFRLLDVWRWQDARKVKVMLKFQGPTPLDVTLENATGRVRGRRDTIYVRAQAPAENLTIVIKLQDAFYSVVLNAFDRVRGQRRPSVNKTQTVRAVDVTFPNVVTYSAGDDVTFDVEVASGFVASSGVVFEDLSFKTYVKTDDGVIGDGGDDLLTVSNKTVKQDGRAVFQVDLDTEDEPQGLAIVEASVGFQPDISPVVRAIKVKKIVEFYSTEKGSVLDDRSLKFFRGKSRYRSLWPQGCDRELPKCTISCIVFHREPVVDFKMLRIVDYSFKRLDVFEETDFGVIHKLLFTTSDLDNVGDYDLLCNAKAGVQAGIQEQHISIYLKQRPTLRASLNAAELHANQTLEVRCVAHGLPVPDITITTDDDPSKSLRDRFPAESSSMWTEIGHRNQVRYMLNKPSFTSSLNSVTCTASNGYGPPDEAVLQVVPVA